MAEILIGSINKGKAEGVAELDAQGRVPSTQLPSYVDDVLEFANLAGFPATGETGKIYIAMDTNKTYRWSGTGYADISPSLALGTTSATAFRGDQGNTAYDHALTSGNPHNVKAVQLGGVLPISKGGTGATTTTDARKNIDAPGYIVQTASGGIYSLMLANPDKSTRPWLRSGSAVNAEGEAQGGFIPSYSNSTLGFGLLGMSTWPFREAHIKTIYGQTDAANMRGVTPVANGGTGASTIADAANNMQTWFLGGGGKSISQNADLNQLLEIGNYCCELNSTAKTIVNSPIPADRMEAFIMKVFAPVGDTVYIAQQITLYDSGGTFRRHKLTSSVFWGPWKQVGGYNAATTTTAGLVKIDGTTIKTDANGAIYVDANAIARALAPMMSIEADGTFVINPTD